MEASLLFQNGPILTMDKRRPETDALAIVGDRIAALGDEARAMRGAGTKVFDLAGRFAMPGFVDAHNHFVHYGVRLMRLDLSNVRSKDELLDSVKERAAMTPIDGWVVGHSWDEAKWREPTLPTRHELDQAVGARKALLQRVDRHGGLASSAAMGAAGVSAAAGSAFLAEEPYGKVVDLTEPALPTLVKGVAAATRRAHELGITSSHVICHGEDLAALQAAREAGALGVRVSCYLGEEHLGALEALGVRRGLGDAWVRVMGLKLYADGSFGSHSAAISGAYAGLGQGGVPGPGPGPGPGPSSGIFVHDEGKLEVLVKRADAAGLQLAVHAIGDRAAKRVLDAFEAANVGPLKRARIEHLEMVDDADLKRAASMGVVASVQPNFTGEWGHRGGMYEARLGSDRAAKLNRFKRYQEEGLPLAFGSDDMPLGPLYGIRSAVEADGGEQRVSVEEALRAYTAGAAWAAFAEDEVGALRVGMLADVVVLSRDPRLALDGLRVDATVAGGRLVHGRIGA